MKKALSYIALSILALLVLTPSIFAKCSPSNITISGAGLKQPIEITAPKLLQGFDPWTGRFLDETHRVMVGPPQVDRLYDILILYGT